MSALETNIENYMQRIKGETNRDKLDSLLNSIDTSVYSCISEYAEYEDAM